MLLNVIGCSFIGEQARVALESCYSPPVVFQNLVIIGKEDFEKLQTDAAAAMAVAREYVRRCFFCGRAAALAWDDGPLPEGRSKGPACCDKCRKEMSCDPTKTYPDVVDCAPAIRTLGDRLNPEDKREEDGNEEQSG